MTVKATVLVAGFWLAVEPAGEILHVPGLAVNISVSVRELRDGSWGKDGAWQTLIQYYTEDINCQLFKLTVRMYRFIHSLFEVAAVAVHIPSGIKQVSTFPSTYIWTGNDCIRLDTSSRSCLEAALNILRNVLDTQQISQSILISYSL